MFFRIKPFESLKYLAGIISHAIKSHQQVHPPFIVLHNFLKSLYSIVHQFYILILPNWSDLDLIFLKFRILKIFVLCYLLIKSLNFTDYFKLFPDILTTLLVANKKDQCLPNAVITWIEYQVSVKCSRDQATLLR